MAEIVDAIVGQYAWVIWGFLGLIGLLAIAAVLLMRHFEFGPFKRWTHQCFILIGIPPNCGVFQSPGRIDSKDMQHPIVEFKNMKGTKAPLPSYTEFVNRTTLMFYGVSRDCLHVLEVVYDSGLQTAVLHASTDERARAAYKQNTKYNIERTTEKDKLAQYLPAISAIIILLVLIFGGYWLTSMSAANLEVAAAKPAAQCFCNCTGAGILPP